MAKEMMWIPVTDHLPATRQRVIVRFVNDYGRKVVTVADYIAPRTVREEDYISDECPADFADYEEETDTYWTPGGWYESQETADMNWYIEWPVTEWMEMPE